MENSIMNIEKHNLKMFNTITIIVLAAILLTVIGGLIIRQQSMPAQAGGMRLRSGDNPMRPELTQTGPTGKLVVDTGIILLMVGFGVIILMLLVRRNWLRHNPS
jgi:hypothetical protein